MTGMKKMGHVDGLDGHMVMRMIMTVLLAV